MPNFFLMNISDYFKLLNEQVDVEYKVAGEARKQGWDPEDRVDIPVAKNKAERCVNLVGAEAPEVIGTRIPERIHELEKQYGTGDFRIALIISYEVASEKYCKFESRVKALEAGMRLGIAFITLGTVSAPLEGFVELKLKKTNDNKEYIAIFFAGPIRAAGGTAAAVCVLIADYLRFKFGYARYDITREETDRYVYEIGDYNAMVTRLQYMPKEEEQRFLLKHIGVEISGDPTTDFDVSNGKGIERVDTDKIRGGMCLVLSEVAQKAGKLWRRISSWTDFGFNEWDWINEFLKLQKSLWSGSEKKEDDPKSVGPNWKFMFDAVAGRPIFAYPFRRGGFRLRYGRTRFMGHECIGFNPATMAVTNNFMAIGTQLKVERPGKGCTVTPCEVLDGPVVELKNGDVVRVDSFDEAKKIAQLVNKILFLGDMLVNVGAFREHGHKLIPGAYVPERWVLELARAVPEDKRSERINELINNPFSIIPGFDEAINLSKDFGVPLHPNYLFYYDIALSDLQKLSELLSPELPNSLKPVLNSLGVPHKVSGDKLVLSELDYNILFFTLKNLKSNPDPKLSVFDLLTKNSGVVIKNKAPVFIGARMGRPEKAKLRKLTGSPHCMFPCGQEGGRLRSFNAAFDVGFIEGDFELFYCDKCKRETVLNHCESCGSRTRQRYVCVRCNRHVDSSEHCNTKCKLFDRLKVDMKKVIPFILKNISDVMPPLVKGVRGTSNRTHIPESLEKGILRAKHGVYVCKDSTIRLDFTELSLTHFKPKEIGTSIDKLISMGYTNDCYGLPLERDDQILELMPQDVIVGASTDFHDADMSASLLKIANFIDDELVRLYKLKPFYKAKRKEDLIGSLVICLAPHTSAGIVARVIGYSKTQAIIAHPYMHAGCRRDCDGDELGIMLLMDALLNFSRQYLPDRRGGRSMDSPLVLTTNLSPEEVDDEVYDFDRGWVYPLSFYELADDFGAANKSGIPVVGEFLGKPEQYFGFGFTHPVNDINAGLHATAYKTLGSMMDKLDSQMELATKTVAVDDGDVAGLIINKHFLRDIKGNLRKFTEQSFRCVNCNAKFRRLPLIGKCLKCEGKLLLTVHEGTVTKYLEPSLKLAEKYNVPVYLKQSLDILRKRVDGMFGWKTQKQTALDNFFK